MSGSITRAFLMVATACMLLVPQFSEAKANSRQVTDEAAAWAACEAFIEGRNPAYYRCGQRWLFGELVPLYYGNEHVAVLRSVSGDYLTDGPPYRENYDFSNVFIWCPEGMYIREGVSGDPGICEPCHGDRHCDDGLRCTVNSCDLSTHECVTQSRGYRWCTCDSAPIPNREVTLPAVELDQFSIDCPFVSGDAGLSLGVTGTYSHQQAACDNMCTTSDSGMLNVAVGVNFCSASRSPLSVALMGAVQRQDQGCLACTDGACDQICESDSCVTESYTGGASASVSRAIGMSLGPKRMFGSRWQVHCAAEVTGMVSLSGNRAETSGSSSCNTCDECTSVGFTSSLSGRAAATCRVTGGFFGNRINVGLQDLASIEASFSGTNSGNIGDCGGGGDTYCGSTLASIKGAARIPLSARGTRWWGLRGGRELACTATWNGCAEQNSCGTCTTCAGCAQQGATFSCGVLAVQ